MSFEPREYLRHILAEADYLVAHSRGLTPERFHADETLRRAFVRSLEIIGEAAKKVPPELRSRHPSIEWRAMAGLRDYDLVWDVVTTKIPDLKHALERIV